MGKDNQLLPLLKKTKMSENELDEWYNSLINQYFDILESENPSLSENEKEELAASRARSTIEQRMGVLNRTHRVMLYGDDSVQRLSYIKDAIDNDETKSLKLSFIDLNNNPNSQLDILMENGGDSNTILFLDNIDKASHEVYESARFLIKGPISQTFMMCIAGLAKKEVGPNYIDDGFVTSCLHIEI